MPLRIAIMTLALISPLCMSFPGTARYCIEKTIEEDKQIYKLAEQAREEKSAAEAFREMTQKMRSISLTGCPPEFRSAIWSISMPGRILRKTEPD